MKLFAPAYYKKFVCIADKCEHSCCVGWEIDIDEPTLFKYQSLNNTYAPEIIKSISKQGTPHFKLAKGDKCPHLDQNGLCKIILNLGDDYLCQICREHPRFYNYTDVCEVGLGMSCPEAARIILGADNYDVFDEIGKVDAFAVPIDFDGKSHREELYQILKNGKIDYASRLEQIRSQYNINPIHDDVYLDIINTMEYLDNSHKALFNNYSSSLRPWDMDKYLRPALAYFIYRHCTEAWDIDDFSQRLSFCLFCEQLLASLISSQNATTLKEIAKLASIISEEIEYSEDNTQSLMLAGDNT